MRSPFSSESATLALFLTFAREDGACSSDLSERKGRLWSDRRLMHTSRRASRQILPVHMVAVCDEHNYGEEI